MKPNEINNVIKEYIDTMPDTLHVDRYAEARKLIEHGIIIGLTNSWNTIYSKPEANRKLRTICESYGYYNFIGDVYFDNKDYWDNESNNITCEVKFWQYEDNVDDIVEILKKNLKINLVD